MRDVRQSRQQFVDARFGLFAFLIQFGDAIFQLIYCFAPSVGLCALAVFHQRANLAAGRVPLSVKLIRFGDHLPAFCVGPGEIIQSCGRQAALLERGAHAFKVFPHVVEIEH